MQCKAKQGKKIKQGLKKSKLNGMEWIGLGWKKRALWKYEQSSREGNQNQAKRGKTSLSMKKECKVM